MSYWGTGSGMATQRHRTRIKAPALCLSNGLTESVNTRLPHLPRIALVRTRRISIGVVADFRRLGRPTAKLRHRFTPSNLKRQLRLSSGDLPGGGHDTSQPIQRAYGRSGVGRSIYRALERSDRSSVVWPSHSDHVSAARELAQQRAARSDDFCSRVEHPGVRSGCIGARSSVQGRRDDRPEDRTPPGRGDRGSG